MSGRMGLRIEIGRIERRRWLGQVLDAISAIQRATDVYQTGALRPYALIILALVDNCRGEFKVVRVTQRIHIIPEDTES